MHYSEHSITNINDVNKKFNNVLNIALADGNVSSSEMVDILNVSNDYYNVLRRVYNDSNDLVLDAKLLENMKVVSYKSTFETFKLPPPSRENINDWVNVIGGWAGVALKALHKLRNEALELLLDTEDSVKEAFLNNKSLGTVPSIKGIPEDYATLVPGTERKIQRKLGAWDRFATGDGIVPSLAKFGIAGGILFAAIFYGNQSQKLPFYIYNGLQTDITVNIDNSTISLKPNTSESIQLNYGRTYPITAKTFEGYDIENEKFTLDSHHTYVYNVANSGVFIEHPIFYGYGNRTPKGINDSKILGAKKFFSSDADYILEEPPAQISLPSGSLGERKEELKAFSNISPENLVSIIENEGDLKQIIKSHSYWDDGTSKHTLTWLSYLRGIDNGVHILESRLKRVPDEFISLRLLQDLSDSLSHRSICEKQKQLSVDHPEKADYYYLATRCIEDEVLKDQKFIEGHKKWKNHAWLAYAAAYVYNQDNNFKLAYDAYKIAAKNNLALGEILADDAERIKRLINLRNNENLKTIVTTRDIDFYKTIESGNIEGEKSNPDYVYYLIYKGELEEAYKLSQNFENIKGYTQYLIAASNGATQVMKDAAFKNTDYEGLNLNTAWSVLGLAVKENKDYKPYLNTFESLKLEDGFMEELLKLIKAKNYNAVDKHIEVLQFRWKAQTYVLAHIILDGNIPLKWKQILKAGLFANEKPFF